MTSVHIPDSVTRIGNYAFANCKRLTSMVLPQSVVYIGEGAFAGCITLDEFAISNPTCKAGQNLFGDHYCDQITVNAKPYYHALTGGDYKRYILKPENWMKVDADLQAEMFLARQSKSLLTAYGNCIPDGEKLGEAILKQICSNASVKACKGAANFMITFSQRTSQALLQRLYNALKTIKVGAKAIKSIGADAVLMQKLAVSEPAELPKSMIERKMVDIMNLKKLAGNMVDTSLKEYYGLSVKDIPEVQCRDGQIAPPTVVAFLLTAHEKRIASANGKEVVAAYEKAGVCPEAAQILAELDAESLQNCLKKLAKDNLGVKGRTKKMLMAYPICRYADEMLMEKLTKATLSWSNVPRSCFAEATLYSNTHWAMYYADTNHLLKRYAAIRQTTEDGVRDQFSDIGLDEKGGKHYDLGNQSVIARLQKDLSFLIELPNGKTAKSLPKKDADMQKYAAADADYSEMKKAAKNIVQHRGEALFRDFLSGRTRNAEDWRASYLHNPLLRSLASRVVWQQGNSSFILKDGSPVDCAGRAYIIGKAPILLAHPMELQKGDVAAWQQYLAAQGIEQPFVQMWEPVVDSTQIQEKRYAGATIPFHRFLNQEPHGICVEDSDFHNQLDFYFKD